MHFDIFSPQRLRDMIGEVEVIVDVGVGQGTHGLYKAFRTAKLVLCDPLLHHEVHKRSLEDIRGQYQVCQEIPAALGLQPCYQSFTFDKTRPHMSSFHRVRGEEDYNHIFETRMTRVTTLDKEYDELNFKWPEPILLKIDAEGSELDIVDGGKNFIRNHVKHAIIEVNMGIRNLCYGPERLITKMANMGFVMTNILFVHMRRDDTFVRAVDILFSKEEA